MLKKNREKENIVSKTFKKTNDFTGCLTIINKKDAKLDKCKDLKKKHPFW